MLKVFHVGIIGPFLILDVMWCQIVHGLRKKPIGWSDIVFWESFTHATSDVIFISFNWKTTRYGWHMKGFVLILLVLVLSFSVLQSFPCTGRDFKVWVTTEDIITAVGLERLKKNTENLSQGNWPLDWDVNQGFWGYKVRVLTLNHSVHEIFCIWCLSYSCKCSTCFIYLSWF
jgi:hypothetical protein